jgi:hypothetical protein
MKRPWGRGDRNTALSCRPKVSRFGSEVPCVPVGSPFHGRVKTDPFACPRIPRLDPHVVKPGLIRQNHARPNSHVLEGSMESLCKLGTPTVFATEKLSWGLGPDENLLRAVRTRIRLCTFPRVPAGPTNKLPSGARDGVEELEPLRESLCNGPNTLGPRPLGRHHILEHFWRARYCGGPGSPLDRFNVFHIKIRS